MIIRAIHDRNNPFFLMRRATAQDKRLSWQARGLLAYLFSKHDDWTVRYDDLIAQVAETNKPLGHDGISSILKELEDNGYLLRTKRQGEKGQIKWDTEIHETPFKTQPSRAQPSVAKNRKTEEKETKERQHHQRDFAVAA